MKFEHVLHIYWTKGLFINAHLLPFNTNFNTMFRTTKGFSWATKNSLIRRFELFSLERQPNESLSDLGLHIPMAMNVIFSKLTSVNHVIAEITRFSLLRLYLIKTTRGRSHALGKPSRGQRTWSNAWSAYSTNNETRAFISAYQKLNKQNVKEEKINYKLKKKKSLRRKKKEGVTKEVVRVNHWF